MSNSSQSVAYHAAVSRMYELGHELTNLPSQKFDLAHMRKLLVELGSPQTKFPSVLIAGTNGKGSTAATLASILQAAGYCTGLYTSPHLVRINERIRITGATISDADFALLHERVERAAQKLVASGELPWHPSFFEMVTAIAFQHFASAAVEIAVLEVGMGGRLDATNVVEPLLSVIADIALDHQKYLGDTLTEIAREKAGIVRAGKVAVLLPQMAEANDALGQAIEAKGARGVNATPYVPPVSPGALQLRAPSSEYQVGEETRFGQTYHLQVFGQEIFVETPLIGRHQLRNVALAIAAAEELTKQGFEISASDLERGIRETRWPGRLQRVVANGVELLLDVAHNPAGAWALRAALSELHEDRPLTFVFGAMRDKAIGEMAEILFPLAERVILTAADNPRSAVPAEIRAAAGRVAVEFENAGDVGRALQRAREITPANGLVVVTGSIYIVGEAMRALGVGIEQDSFA